MAVRANGDIARLFGNPFGFVDEISDLIRNQTNNINITQSTRYSSGRQSLAPSFGGEGSLRENLRGLYEKLKVLIAISNREMLRIPEGQRDWEKVQACFLANPSARAMDDAVHISRKLESNTTANFKFGGKPDHKLVQQVMNWWEDIAVPDEDIRKDTKVDIKTMADIVARSGAVVSNFFRVFHAYERREERMFDIGALRYPDIFKIYRIELFAFSDCTRTLFHQCDTNGIRCVLTYRKFEPRVDFIRDIKEDTKQKALREVDNLFP